MESAIRNLQSAIWHAPPWRGEFGWEVMSWAPFCRALSRHQPVTVTSFAASAALYADFAAAFRDHGVIGRTLDYPKSFAMYHSAGPAFEHYLYGDPDRAEPFDVLIHARGIRRKRGINYRSWSEVLAGLSNLKVAAIGTLGDEELPGVRDLRGLDLPSLMDLFSSAAAARGITIGCSSGTMHLAAGCGCGLVVWGDTKTRYNETLEKRYKETWNPHHVDVGWLDADDWQPDPSRVLAAVEQRLKSQI